MTTPKTKPNAGARVGTDPDDAESAIPSPGSSDAASAAAVGGAEAGKGPSDGAKPSADAGHLADEGFTRHMHRRKVANYERSLARSAYAYGVDLRRSTWLARSSVGEIMLRSLDRRWPKLAKDLVQSSLVSLQTGEELPLLRELERTIALLRAPAPTLWLLRDDAPDRMQWPIVTALGAQHGDVRWLIVDPERLERLTHSERCFELAAGISHLQNDHGALLTAHLLAHREGTLRRLTLRAGLYPWSQVMAFSSDRAGLIRLGTLAPALAALRRTVIAEGICPWYPQTAPLRERERALEDFARTDVFARLCATRKSQAAMAQGAQDLGVEQWSQDDATHEDAPIAGATEAPDAANAADACDAANATAGAEPAQGRRTLIPENAWSLARVDNRLTHRLGVY